MQFTGDVLRSFDLDSGADVAVSETLLPAFNRGTTTPDASGRRYAAYIAHDSSDIAIVDLRPKGERTQALAGIARAGEWQPALD